MKGLPLMMTAASRPAGCDAVLRWDRMWWKVKAFVQRSCAALPGGSLPYDAIQKTFGKLLPIDVAKKLALQRDLALRLARLGISCRGATAVEVGTGWVPLDAVGFWMCGARRIETFDLNRHLSRPLFRKALAWMNAHPNEVVALWSDLSPEGELRNKLLMLARLGHDPEAFLREAGITYHAPADAGHTGLPDASVDVHFSYNVLEHMPSDAIARVLAEGRRILKPDGVSVHYVDPTDHFSHFDVSITGANFLRFEPKEWDRIAGNRFAYHNRLRDADYRALFDASGLKLSSCLFEVDQRSLAALRQGFPLASPWRQSRLEELCRYNLVYVASPVAAILADTVEP